MCQVSMVYDYYRDKFPQPQPWWQQPHFVPTSPAPSGLELEEIRKLIAEFREAVALAKRLDVVMKQPDCEDLEKKKLEERVAELERRLDAMAPCGV